MPDSEMGECYRKVVESMPYKYLYDTPLEAKTPAAATSSASQPVAAPAATSSASKPSKAASSASQPAAASSEISSASKTDVVSGPPSDVTASHPAAAPAAAAAAPPETSKSDADVPSTPTVVQESAETNMKPPAVILTAGESSSVETDAEPPQWEQEFENFPQHLKYFSKLRNAQKNANKTNKRVQLCWRSYRFSLPPKPGNGEMDKSEMLNRLVTALKNIRSVTVEEKNVR